MTKKKQSQGVSPRTLFRSFAIAEMFTWAGLIAALILRALEVVNIVPIAGGIHGFVFLCYSATTIFVWVNQRWRLSLGLTGLLLAIVPFATVPFEITVEKKDCSPATGDLHQAERHRTVSSRTCKPGCSGMSFSRSLC
ncbi:DUF3817 domain-containing protein [Leucobacter soli]|uniref:DUF3817 domain-containing protein n=1 Tax=Leucobacter soli TaxID=2812850 RepID=UPI003606DE6E